MFPQQTVEFTWGFRLKNKNTTDVPQYMGFNIKYGSKRDAVHRARWLRDSGGDHAGGGAGTGVHAGWSGHGALRVDRYEPTPFYVDLHIENIGTGEARNVKAYMLAGHALYAGAAVVSVAGQSGSFRVA
jgi:hypothetical protein